MTNQVSIQYSLDGGETWSAEIWSPLIGSDKDYLNRVIIPSIPAAYSAMFRIKNSDSASFTLVSASADIEVGI